MRPEKLRPHKNARATRGANQAQTRNEYKYMRALKRQEIVCSGETVGATCDAGMFRSDNRDAPSIFFFREMRGIGRNEARKAIVLLLLVGVRDRDTKEAVDKRRTERAASEMQQEGAVIYPFR